MFGAAGRTGAEVLRVALAKGHEVTAVVRDASAVTEEKVTVAVADVHDQDQVTAAVAGVDAVISTLGGKPRQPTSVYSDGIVKITTAMREQPWATPFLLVAPSMIARADLADYLVTALDDADTYRKIMEISN